MSKCWKENMCVCVFMGGQSNPNKLHYTGCFPATGQVSWPFSHNPADPDTLHRCWCTEHLKTLLLSQEFPKWQAQDSLTLTLEPNNFRVQNYLTWTHFSYLPYYH